MRCLVIIAVSHNLTENPKTVMPAPPKPVDIAENLDTPSKDDAKTPEPPKLLPVTEHQLAQTVINHFAS